MGKLPLHWKILIGMAIGATAGIAMQASGAFTTEELEHIAGYVKPVGDIFLRMVFMMVIPLVISALTLGIAELGDLKKIGRIGVKAMSYFVLVTSFSVITGVAMVQIIRPGESISDADRTKLVEKYAGKAAEKQEKAKEAKTKPFSEFLVSIVPKNPLEDMSRAFDPTYKGGGLLAVMFFAVMMGIAVAMTDEKKVAPLKGVLEGLYEVTLKIIGMAMQLAPYGVAALLFSLTATLGFSVIGIVIQYVFVVVAALAAQQFITYPILVKVLGKMNPVDFFRQTSEVMLTAFSTSSSQATLPTALRVLNEKLKLPKEISNFVMTFGATANHNGTALYEGVTVLFLAQCFGIQLSIGQQITVVMMCIIAGFGVASVPGGSLPMIVLVLNSMGIPGESIALIFGVDRILDMCRTTVNVTGDMSAAVFVCSSEAGNLEEVGTTQNQ